MINPTEIRAHALDLAIRTPGVGSHSEVLAAAQAYQKHIEGGAESAGRQPAPGAALAGYSTMLPHQQRVVDEKCELEARMAKLAPFFDTPTFASLPEDEKERLHSQLEVMLTYSTILTDRIAAFAPATAV